MKCSGFLDVIPSLSPMHSCVVCWYSLQCGVSREDQETGTNVADKMTVRPPMKTVIHRHDVIYDFELALLFHTRLLSAILY